MGSPSPDLSQRQNGTIVPQCEKRATRAILVTGFGSFPHAPVNPTGPLVRALLRLRHPALTGIRLTGHIFTTAYESVDRDLPTLLARHRPDALLMFGLAQRRKHVSIELLARNAVTLSADASGTVPWARDITAAQVRRIQARTPARRLLRAAQTSVLTARLSHDAGAYLCNYLLWRATEAAQKSDGPKFASFVHVPMPRDAQARAALEESGCSILLALAKALRTTH